MIDTPTIQEGPDGFRCYTGAVAPAPGPRASGGCGHARGVEGEGEGEGEGERVRVRVRVESTVSRPRCLHCGFKCHKVHDVREREVRDLEVSGRRTVLVWMRHRFSCGNCGERFLEDHFEFDGRLTRRLAHRLVADAQVMTIRAVARRHGVSWPVINTLVRAWSGLIAEHRRSRRCKVLLVDETSMRKRHGVVTFARITPTTVVG